MSYKDQLVATGELSDTGQELSRNIPDSYRRGIELSASLNIARWFSLGANATLSQNRIENYTEYVSEYDADWNYLGEKELYLGTSTLSYSPSVIAGVLLDFPCQRVQRPAAYAVCRQTILYQRPQRCAVARRLLCHQPEPGV